MKLARRAIGEAPPCSMSVTDRPLPYARGSPTTTRACRPRSTTRPSGSMSSSAGPHVRYPDQTALIFFGRKTNYRALDEAVNRVASGLQRLGLAPGERVGLFMPNCPQLVIAFYAVWRAGGVAVPITRAPPGPRSRGTCPTPRRRRRSSLIASGWVSRTQPCQRPCDISSWPMSRTVCRSGCASAPWITRRVGARRPVRDRHARARRVPGSCSRASPGRVVASQLRGPSGAALHGRHDRAAQGGRADPSQPGRQRLPACGLDAGARRRGRGHAVGPAARPRLRDDRLYERLDPARLDAGPRP